MKLEEIIYKKSHPEERGIDVDLPHKYPIEKSSATFLSNCPDYSDKYLIDMAKNYINRKKVSVKEPASIFQIEL